MQNIAAKMIVILIVTRNMLVFTIMIVRKWRKTQNERADSKKDSKKFSTITDTIISFAVFLVVRWYPKSSILYGI